MNSGCESHYPTGDRKPEEAGGNCVAARRGGEQPEANVRSQTVVPTMVNSIRPWSTASLLAKGEACRESGEPATAQSLSMLDAGVERGGWSGNAGKGSWLKIRERRGRLTCGAVRALIVATKPGNAGGAKGRRKVNAQ